jgi:hypothetical protein
LSLPFMVKKDEKVLKSCKAHVESTAQMVTKRLGFGAKSKTVKVKGESGTLYLTNLRIVFAVEKGRFSKTTTITKNNPLEDIENLSVSGTLGKGLNIDWKGGHHDRFSGLDDPNAWESEIRALISSQ